MNATRAPAVAERPHADDVANQRVLDALETRRLVDQIAPLFGLEPSSIHVYTDGDGDRALRLGARGLAHGHDVFLAPGFEPLTPGGRGLVAHELAHVAQQRRPAPVVSATERALLDAAEAEARELAVAARNGTTLWRPLVPLPHGTEAADTGTATLPKPATTTPPAKKDAAGEAAADDAKAGPSPVDIGILRGRLKTLVKERHKALIETMDKKLSGLWVSSDDAMECLRLLEPLPFVSAREVAGALESQRARDLGRALEDGHHRSYPAAALAALASMSPMILRFLDPWNVEGLTPGQGAVERRAALEVLRGLRPPVLEELIKGAQAPKFVELLTGPAAPTGTLLPPFGTDESALLAAIDAEQVAGKKERGDSLTKEQHEARAATIKKAIDDLLALLAAPSQADAVKALQQLAAFGTATAAPEPNPSAKTSPTGPGAGTPSGTDAGTKPSPPSPPVASIELRLVVRELEAKGAITRLLDALGNDERWAGARHAPQLLAVLAAREPQRNLSRAIELLSYGILDWKIFDSEARFAYVLVRAVPVDQQDRWKRLDAGKWFARLEDNIPSDDVTGGFYRGVGSRADAFSPGAESLADYVGLYAAMAVVKAIDSEINDKGVTGASSVVLVRKILAVGRKPGLTTPAIPGPGGGLPNRRQIEIVADRLDALGHLDKILDALPDAYLLNEQWRPEMLELMAARDPRHLERHARRLLSYDWDDWAVTAREAWLAFYLVRSLSADDRARLEAEDPERFAKIQGEMTSGMRASSANTVLGGRQTFETRDRLRDRLRDDRVWSKARLGELRAGIIGLYALDDRRWVFLRSREIKAYENKDLLGLVDDLGLYKDPGRTSFEPEQLRSTATGEEGIFQLIAEYARLIAVGVEVLWLARESLTTDTIRVDDLDLSHLSWALGGDIGGARVADKEAVKRADAKKSAARQAAQGSGSAPGGPVGQGKAGGAPAEANRLSFKIDPGEGLIKLTLPRLELAGFNRAFTNMSLRTGKISVTGLEIEASFSDRGYERPVGAKAEFKRADVADTVVASDGLPGGLLSANQLGIAPLRFRSGATGAENIKAPGKNGWIAIPVLDPFLRVLSHIVSFLGTIPGLTSSIPGVIGPGDIITAPFTGGAPWLAQKFTSFTTDEVATPILEGALGLITDGVFRKPRTVTERAKDAAAMMRYFSVSIGSLDVQGLSLGGMQDVQSVQISNLLIGIGRSRPTALRVERDSIDNRLRRPSTTTDERAGLLARRKEVTAELAKLEGIEKELDRLEARHRWNENALKPEEKARLLELSNQLRQTAGVSLDVGAVAIGRLSGVVNAAGIDIGPIHAEVSGESRSGEYLPPDVLVKRFQAERDAPTIRSMAGGIQAGATVGSLTLRTEPGQKALRLILGNVPTVAQVRRQIVELGDDPRFAEMKAKLEKWVTPTDTGPSPLARLEYLESLPAEPVDLDRKYIEGSRSRREEQELQVLRQQAREFFSITVESLRVQGITATYDPKRLGIGIEVGSLTATGIDAGVTHIDEISGTKVRAGVALDAPSDVGAGRLPDDYERRLADAGLPGTRPALTFGAGSLTVKGARHPGLDVGRVTLNGLDGTVVTDGSTLKIPNLVVQSAELEAITYEGGGRKFYALGTTKTGKITASLRIETVAVPKSPAAGVIAEKTGYKPTTLVVESLRIVQVDADRLGMDVTAPKPGYSVEATSGSLHGIWVENMVIPLGDSEAPITGKLGVEQVDQLRFIVVSRALKGGPTTIKGTLTSPPAEGTKAGAVRVELLKSGTKTIDVSGTTLSEGELTTPDGTVKIRKAGLNGHIEQDPSGQLRFSDVGPLDVDVSYIDWKIGDGRVTASGSTKLQGVEAAGSWKSEPDKEVGGVIVPGHAVLHLDRLRIKKVTSDDLRYRDTVLDIRLGKDPSVKRPDLLEINDVNVTGLHWETGLGVTKGTVKTGTAKVEAGGRVAGTYTPPTRTGVAGTVTDALYAKVGLEASSIDLTFHEKGRIVARVRGGKGDVGIGDTVKADQHHGSFEDLDSGVVDIHDDKIEIGPDGSDGLFLKLLTLDKLDWNFAGTSGIGVQLNPGDGKVTLAGTQARATVELHPKGTKPSRFKRLTLRQLEIAETRGTGLAIRLGSLVLRLDKTTDAVFGKLVLTPAAGEAGFIVEPKSSGSGLNLLGQANLSAFKLPQLAADIAGSVKAKGNVAADSLTADFLGVAGIRVSVTNPSVTDIEAQLSGDPALTGKPSSPSHTLFLIAAKGPSGLKEYGIRAKKVTYEDTDEPGKGPVKKLTVSGAEINGINYTNADAGITISVRHAETPGDVVHDFRRGPKGGGEIPELVIDDATFTIDVPTLLSKIPPGPSRPAATGTAADRLVTNWNRLAVDLIPYTDLIDNLQGDLGFVLNAGARSIPFALQFVNGTINYNVLERVTLPRASDKGLNFKVEGNTLVLEHSWTNYNILEWNLSAGEVATATGANRVRIIRLLSPTPASQQFFAEQVTEPTGGPPNERLSVTGITSDLSITNPKEVPLPLDKPNELVLAPNAITHLKVAGAIGGTDVAGVAQAGKLTPITLEAAKIQRSKIVLTAAELKTGNVDITGVDNTSLTFSGFTPLVLSGHITKATAKKIEWDLK